MCDVFPYIVSITNITPRKYKDLEIINSDLGVFDAWFSTLDLAMFSIRLDVGHYVSGHH